MAEKIFRRRIKYRLAALLCLIFIAGLFRFWSIHRQRRIERNVRLDQFALQAKRLIEFIPYDDYNLWRECARDEVAVRWQMEIARRRGVPNEAEAALQECAARLTSVAARARRLEQAGSKGGEEQDVALVQSKHAQVQVALAQLRGGGREVRDSLAAYIACLRRYRDAVRKVSAPKAAGAFLPEIDLAAAKVVQAELSRDRQAQVAALREHLAAVQEFARSLSNNESNALAVMASQYAAARIRAQLACGLQDEAGELAAWQEALAHLNKLRVAEFGEPTPDEDSLSGHRGYWGEVDFAMRLPQPNLLIETDPPDHLSPQAAALELAVLAELSAICGEAARRTERENQDNDESQRNPYWTGWKALADIMLEDAWGPADK
jgi:hypothetical protein